MRELTWLLVGLLSGVTCTFLFLSSPKEPTCDQLEKTYKGMRLCLQYGGTCRMETKHFIEYYNIEEELKQCKTEGQ